MVAMMMMKASIHQIIYVIAMRNRFVAAIWPVNMVLVMTDRIFKWPASIRIGGADFDDMFIDMITMGMMQMTIVKIVDMIIMFHCNVATVRAVLMVMVCMMRQIAIGHYITLLFV